MTVALDLAPVPVSALTSRRDRFRCDPYRCVMPARDCLARQAKAKLPDLTHQQRMEITRCVGCALGAEVAQKLASVEEDARPLAVVAGSPCAVEGCAKPAERDGLCVKHFGRQSERTRAMNRERAAANEIAASLAPAPSPAPAVERPAVVAAPAPTPTVSTEVPMVASKTCGVRGCTSAPAGVRADTKPWIAPFCSGHRLRAYEAVRVKRATEDTVLAYLSEGPHKNGPKPGTKIAARAKAPTPRPAPANDPAATEAADGTLTVTIALPDELARASRVVSRVGGIDALERLVDAVLAVRP